MNPGSTISLVTCNGQYVSFANGILGANQRTIGPTEIFTLEATPDGWAIQTSYGNYVSANGGGSNSLVSVKDRPGAWGIFEIVDLSNGCKALKAFNGKYVSAEGGGGLNLTANRTAIDRWETFGLVERSVPQPIAQVSQPGSPLIATCLLNRRPQLLIYNPATGDLYRCPILDSGLDTPMLINRGNSCDRGCSQIVAGDMDGDSPYVLTYRRADGRVSLHHMNRDGVLITGPFVSVWPQDFARLTSVGDGNQTWLFYAYHDGGGPIERYHFSPRAPNPFFHNPDAEEPFSSLPDSDGSQHTQVIIDGSRNLLRYRGTTGEALRSTDQGGYTDSYWLGMYERNWEQIVSFIDANRVGHVICLPANSTDLSIYRVTASGLDQKISCPLPAMRPPTVRLHAVATQQLLEVYGNEDLQLRPDSALEYYSELEILPDASGAFRMRSINGYLVRVADDGSFHTTADSNRDATSLFRMVPQPGACFRLRTESGKYVWIDPQDGLLKASADDQIQLQGSARSVFEWNDYGVGGGNSYLDQFLGQVAVPAALSGLTQIHSEYDAAAKVYSFSTRSTNEAAAAGSPFSEVLFYAPDVQAPGTVPVYLEQRVDGQPGYHLSTRDAATAAQWGWKQLGIACYAYATQQPGTVPIYRERRTAAPDSQYYFSTRSPARVAAAGFQRMDVAFYAYAPLVPVHSDFSSNSERYDFSTRNASELSTAGYKVRETLFCAYDQPSLGAVPVYIEQRAGGAPGYHLSIRDAATAAQWGWRQLGIAFYAHATQQPGTVPIYREQSADAPFPFYDSVAREHGTGSISRYQPADATQFYYSPRSAAAAAAAGWRQLDVAFYAYLARPYVLARTQLIDAWLGSDTQATPAYRVVLECRRIDGQPMQSALTLSATAPATLQLSDGSKIEVGPGRPITRSTAADGRLSFVLAPGGQLLVPVIKVRADFMGGTQTVAIAPDQNAHRDLARADLSSLGPSGALVKQMIGVLATSTPLAISTTGAARPLVTPPSYLTWNDFGAWAEGAVQTVGKAFDDFGHDVASAFNDAVIVAGQVIKPTLYAVEQAARTVVTTLAAGIASNLAPGSPVMVALQGAANQVQAIVSHGEAAAQSVISQLNAGVRVAIAATVTFINEAGTLGERLFNAFVVDVGTGTSLLIASANEAQKLVLTLIQQAGKVLGDILQLITSRFSWDNLVATQGGINTLLNRGLEQLDSAVESQLGQTKDSVVAQIRGVGAHFDGNFDTWLNSLPTSLLPGPPPAVDSAIEYFQSLVQRGLSPAALSAKPPAASGDDAVVKNSQQRLGDLTSVIDSFVRNMPSDPRALLQQGPKLFFQAVRSLIDGILSGAANLVSDLFDSLKDALRGGIDLVKKLMNAELSIPLLSPLYEQVIMKGNGAKLTLSSLISLLAAMILEGSHQAAAGPRPPFLTPAIADQLGRGQAFSFSADDDTGEQRKQMALAQNVISTVRTALNGVISLVTGCIRARNNDPLNREANQLDLGFFFLSTVISGLSSWFDWSVLGAGNQAAAWNLGIWWAGVAFLGILAESIGPTYEAFRGLYEILACGMKMYLWGLKDQDADADHRTVNGLEGADSLLQGISGGFRLGEYSAPLTIKLCRTAGAATDMTRSLFLFSSTLYQVIWLAT